MPKISFLVLLCVLLPACAVLPAPAATVSPAPASALVEAEEAQQRGDPVAAAAAYERAAGSAATPALAAEYRLRAAELMLRAGAAEAALQRAAGMPSATLESGQLTRLQLLRAEALLELQQPYAAVEALPPSSSGPFAARIEELRARALFATAEPEAEEAAPTPVNEGGIALLLPLSGSLASTGEAVRDGFVAAHFRAGARGRVQLYDANGGREGAVAAYRQALADGAAVVVGPLRKESVAAIAGEGTPPVPVLALNYIDESRGVPSGLYQFGLAPEDEARTAAEHASAQNLHRAIALVPAADWGERALAAFRARFQALGGQLVDVMQYKPGERDFSAPLRTLLRASTGTPGRRQDVDLVFVVARPLEARLIMPMLAFYYAGDLPIYATALAYDGRAEADLNGLRFCDMPWMMSEAAFAAERAEAAELGSVRRTPRLFAFGYDAYALAAALLPGGGGAPSALPGMTGTLGLAGDSAIRRDLQCAQLGATGLSLLEPVPVELRERQ